MRTQFFENFNGSVTAHDPRPHASEKVARAHAVELSARRDGEVALIEDDGLPIATYIDGVDQSACTMDFAA